MNGRDFLRWAREGAVNANLDQAMARRGLRIRAHTPPDTVIAVMWAGAIPYFAHRAAVDLMGKNDPVIARSDPVLRLGVPGHTKYDLSHSLGALRPDLVVQVFAPRPEDVAYVTGLGYVPAPRALGKYATPQLLARIDLSRVPEEEPAPGPPRGALRRLREGSRRSGGAR
jgi:hypothetical protein